MTREEIELINGALGYTAEVCPPNGTPATEYITDRWGRAVRERLHAVVERIVAARVDNERDRVTDQMLARVMEQELRAEAAEAERQRLSERAATDIADLERRLAEQQAAVKALADTLAKAREAAWDEFLGATTRGGEAVWQGRVDGHDHALRQLRAALSDPTALDALIARERSAALREAADVAAGYDPLTNRAKFAAWLRDRADALAAEAEQ